MLEKPFNRFVAGRVANWLMNFLRASGSSGEFGCTTSYFALPSGVRILDDVYTGWLQRSAPGTDVSRESSSPLSTSQGRAS